MLRRSSIHDRHASFETKRRQSWIEMEKDITSHANNFVDTQYTNKVQMLDLYYRKVKINIINYQSSFGLFPSFQLKGSPNVGCIRDTLYCSAAIWALRQCYQKIDDDRGRTYELGQCAVKSMRALLFCWMQQSKSLEQFKTNQCQEFALHSIFSLDGKEVFTTEEYGHLQLGSVSMYLIFLAQMITSGLQIIYSVDEVSFIQQLIFYIERAYRTPDYGFWGRGSKYNDHTPELHASALGAAKAALEAMNGFNLYGKEAACSRSIVYVDIDAYNRNRITFNTMLPRESASKNTDAALLFTISWPVFAIHNSEMISKTVDKCKRKLEGSYGFKRYLRDGYFTAVEDKSREYYTFEEMKMFDKIECQWPMFYAQIVIDAIFRGDETTEEKYMKKLKSLINFTDKGDILPKLYKIDKEYVEEARLNPTHTVMTPCTESDCNRLFLMGQSLWIIAQLLHERALLVNDFDPMRRYLQPGDRVSHQSESSSIQGFYSDLVVHIVPISESARLQHLLLTYGIRTQTPKQIEPIKIWSYSELVRAYNYLGVNKKLKFSGRPSRPIGILGTSKMYRVCSQMIICFPITFETVEFYISHDISLLLDNIREDFEFLRSCWKLKGKPVYCLLIREEHIKGPHKHQMLELLSSLRNGMVNDVRVRMDRMQTIVSSAAVEHLDFMDNLDISFVFNSVEELSFNEWYYKSLTELSFHESTRSTTDKMCTEDFSRLNPSQLENEFRDTGEMDQRNSWRYCQLLAEAARRYGLDNWINLGNKESGFQIREHIENILKFATVERNWMMMRYCSGIMKLFVNSLAPSITNFIVRGKILSLRCNIDEEVVLNKPIQPKDIFDIIYNNSKSDPFFSVIVQEMILFMSYYLSTEPEIFGGILKLRLNWIYEAMKSEMDNFSKEIVEPVDIRSLSPNELKQLVYFVFTCNERPGRSLIMTRRLDGSIGRYPSALYTHAWYILERVEGFMFGENELLQNPILQDMTDYELIFSLTVEGMLSTIENPIHRQTIIEIIQLLYAILSKHKQIYINQVIDIEQIISCAIRKYIEECPDKSASKESFYELEPKLTKGGSKNYLVRAIIDNLLIGYTECMLKSNKDDLCTLS